MSLRIMAIILWVMALINLVVGIWNFNWVSWINFIVAGICVWRGWVTWRLSNELEA